MLARLREAGFDILARNHAEAILSVDFSADVAELVEALLRFQLTAEELIAGGGGEAPSTVRLRHALDEAGWRKHNFRIETVVDGVTLGPGTSHEIDHVRDGVAGRLALEIEWNNKDPFFDRDLENFPAPACAVGDLGGHCRDARGGVAGRTAGDGGHHDPRPRDHG